MLKNNFILEVDKAKRASSACAADRTRYVKGIQIALPRSQAPSDSPLQYLLC